MEERGWVGARLFCHLGPIPILVQEQRLNQPPEGPFPVSEPRVGEGEMLRTVPWGQGRGGVARNRQEMNK